MSLSQGFRATSVIAETREALNGYESLVTLDRIGPALFPRPIQSDALELIINSIKNEGLQSPIQIRKNADFSKPFDLISGQHRLEAYRLLFSEALAKNDEAGLKRFSRIQSMIYPETMSNELAERQCITENLARTNAGSEERKEWAMRYGLLTKFGNKDVEKGKEPKKASAEKKANCLSSWFPDWWRASSIAERTAKYWWSAFAEANGISETPGKATEEQQKQFFAWHLAKIESDKKAKADAAKAKDEAEKEQVFQKARDEWGKRLDLMKTWVDEARSSGINVDDDLMGLAG
jgi:hypothetical protein